jgi:hypothetical protein
MERKINVLTKTLDLNPKRSYQLYLIYIKDRGFRKEIYRCDEEGINELFTTPYEAIQCFMDSHITNLDYWEFMYDNAWGDIYFCDSISEKVDINDMCNWLLKVNNIYDCFDIADLLEDMDFYSYFVTEMSKGENSEYECKLSEWLENVEVTPLQVFQGDWEALKRQFEASLNVKVEV